MNEQVNDGKQLFHIGVTLRQRVFGTDVEISVSTDVSKDLGFHQTVLSNLAVAQLKVFIDDHAPTLPQAPTTDNTNDAEWQAVKAYRVERVAGVHIVKIFTDEFFAYGVRVFPETLANAGYMIAGMPEGDHNPQDWKVLIGKDDKGRAKIIRLKTPSSKGDT